MTTRYRLHGYACDCAKWRPAMVEGAMTFGQMYVARPWDCWVLVYETVTPPIEVRSTDVRHAILCPSDRRAPDDLVAPGPYRVHASIEEAIARLLLTESP